MEEAVKTIKGPGLLVTQFVRDIPPHNSLENIAVWARDCGYKGIQIPTGDKRLFFRRIAARHRARHRL